MALEQPRSAAKPTRAVVIGAGIVGACCAYALREKGYDVTLIEKDQPGQAASLGNSASIGLSSVTPFGTPGMLRKAPRMFLDPMHPLSVRVSHLPRAIPWFLRFAATLTDERVRKIAQARAALLRHAAGAYDRLLGRIGKPELIYNRGLMFVYETADGPRRNGYDIELRRANGIRVEELTGEEARRREPALSDRIQSAVCYPEVRTTVHPGRLTEEIVAAGVAAGVRIVKDQARDFVRTGGKVTAVVTDRGRHDCDLVVIAAGAWSRDLVRKLGLRVMLEAERGYNITVRNTRVPLTTPIVAGSRFVAIVPIDGAIRMTTGAEFAAIDAPPDHAKALRIFEAAAPTLRDFEARPDARWMGSRPSTPDSLPVIDRVPGIANAYCAFGHGHLGVTFGAITGEIVADLASGAQPVLDIAAYRADRAYDGSHLAHVALEPRPNAGPS